MKLNVYEYQPSTFQPSMYIYQICLAIKYIHTHANQVGTLTKYICKPCTYSNQVCIQTKYVCKPSMYFNQVWMQTKYTNQVQMLSKYIYKFCTSTEDIQKPNSNQICIEYVWKTNLWFWSLYLVVKMSGGVWPYLNFGHTCVQPCCGFH